MHILFVCFIVNQTFCGKAKSSSEPRPSRPVININN